MAKTPKKMKGAKNKGRQKKKRKPINAKRKTPANYKKPCNVRKQMKQSVSSKTDVDWCPKIFEIFMPKPPMQKADKHLTKHFVYTSVTTKGKGKKRKQYSERVVYQQPKPTLEPCKEESTVNNIGNIIFPLGPYLPQPCEIPESSPTNRRKKRAKQKKRAVKKKAICKAKKKRKLKATNQKFQQQPILMQESMESEPETVDVSETEIEQDRSVFPQISNYVKKKFNGFFNNVLNFIKGTPQSPPELPAPLARLLKKESKSMILNSQFVYKLVCDLPYNSKVLVFGSMPSKPFSNMSQTVQIIENVDEITQSQGQFKNSSADMIVFNHSLHGSDFQHPVLEANRILKLGGQLALIDIFCVEDNSSKFTDAMAKAGFKLKSRNIVDKTSYEYVFKKTRRVTNLEYIKPFCLTVAKYRKV
ncbi:ribosomal RNA-processing protein 8-like [Teleopsis dalmanni]|uniref:ribosomal RNA-processing protein 8-like n=1 Tax=Teleopsis dalmanni TaxID=139649 RepID=UPI0018CE2B7C|nr:ribosomal RNA-processing protein 8-like [Teleopsis dalmanni]XP_037959907.1 ribosomal RNA-processing protein 8-like [Teleopsis dalmanni]